MRKTISRLCPTSINCKARKKIGTGNRKAKTRPHPVVCRPLPISDKPKLWTNCISKEPVDIDCFCINIPWQCVFRQVLSDSNPLDNVDFVGNQTAPLLLDLFLQNQRAGSSLNFIHNHSRYDLNTEPKEGSSFHRTNRILVTEWVQRVSKSLSF